MCPGLGALVLGAEPGNQSNDSNKGSSLSFFLNARSWVIWEVYEDVRTKRK
jgi:hypothetical protein